MNIEKMMTKERVGRCGHVVPIRQPTVPVLKSRTAVRCKSLTEIEPQLRAKLVGDLVCCTSFFDSAVRLPIVLSAKMLFLTISFFRGHT